MPETHPADEPNAQVESGPAGPQGETSTPDVSGLSYEEARDELVSIVARLESGQVGLDESMSLWQRGDALAARCTELLDAAEKTLTQDESLS